MESLSSYAKRFVAQVTKPDVDFVFGLSPVISIATPKQRRRRNGKALVVRGARENNLKAIDVAFPLGQLVAITGASGSGKSTLVSEVLYKVLWKRLVDTRTLPGEHDGVDGLELVHKVVNIDQSPIGRNSRGTTARAEDVKRRTRRSLA